MKNSLLTFLLLPTFCFGQIVFKSGSSLSTYALRNQEGPPVDINALHAPAAGQILAATDSTHATWQGLPNPSASTLGGVKSQAAVSHQWINAISTSGVPSASQPGWADLSGTPTSANSAGFTNGSNIDAWGVKTIPGGTVVGTSDSQTLANKQLQLIDGTNSSQAIYWTGGTSAPVGISRSNGNILFNANGTNTTLNFNCQNGTMSIGLGTTSVPAYGFNGDANTGVYSPGADQVAMVAGGIAAVRATTSGVRILGTTTNNSAIAGDTGEQISSSIAAGSAVSLTTSTTANLTSISLTAGDWDVSYDIYFIASGATLIQLDSSISTISATLSTVGGEFITNPYSFTGLTATLTQSKTMSRQSLANTTVFYLPVQATFSVGTVSAYGVIRARRVR